MKANTLALERGLDYVGLVLGCGGNSCRIGRNSVFVDLRISYDKIDVADFVKL